MAEQLKQGKVHDLIQDDRNLNKGTERGQQLIEKSLRQFGAGRSILVDKNNRIIAGNKTHANAEAAGIDDAVIVETDGSKLVVVKRTDIDLDTKQGREMALADNASVKVDLDWDTDALNNNVEGMAIVMRGTHLCKTMRGVKSNGQMSVAHLSGVFQENSDARREFYRLIELNK